MELNGKKILVVGMGKSGLAATYALYDLGVHLTLQDSKEMDKIDPELLKWIEGKDISCSFGHLPEDMTVFDIVVLSPGVSPELPFVQKAKESGAEWLQPLFTDF